MEIGDGGWGQVTLAQRLSAASGNIAAAADVHGGGAGGMTLTSTAATSYASLVGVESPTSGEIRVIAGDAANSYLVKKLEGTQGAGNGVQMPRTSTALDNIDLTNIKNWINTGAPNN